MVSVKLVILLTVAALVASASFRRTSKVVTDDYEEEVDGVQETDEDTDYTDEEETQTTSGPGLQTCWIRTLFRSGRLPTGDAVKVVKTLVKRRNTINVYQMPGSLQDALHEFHCAKPRKVTISVNKRGVNVHFGKIGRNRITVKYGGSHGTPTLETRSHKPNGGVHIRIFMYEY